MSVYGNSYLSRGHCQKSRFYFTALLCCLLSVENDAEFPMNAHGACEKQKRAEGLLLGHRIEFFFKIARVFWLV